MKKLWVFPRVIAQVLLIGGFLTVLLAGGPSAETQAADQPSKTEKAEGLAKELTPAQLLINEIKAKAKEMEALAKKHCGGPGSCNGIDVTAGDGSGCASGSKCTVENVSCNPGMHCRTKGMPGQCWCSCSTP